MYSKVTQKMILTLERLGTASTDSSFLKTGKLTPDEFVIAGDFLVQNFPSWSWGSGSKDKIRSHLPADKQFLQTKNVPCLPRKEEKVEEKSVEGEGEDGWMDTGLGETTAVEDLHELGEALPTPQSGVVTGIATKDESSSEGEEDEEEVAEIGDLDAYDYGAAAIAEEDSGALGSAASGLGGDGASVVRTRTYDITITYDVYYSTPRVWLFGYDADHQPLKGNAWREDFSSEHVDKTVTHEAHPHLGYSCPSIHPCKHAHAMQRMIELVVGSGSSSLDVKYYMLIFLKFIQSIIPNIEYDYTSEFKIQGEESK